MGCDRINKKIKKEDYFMAKKDGIYFYTDWIAPFEKLDRAELGELVLAMMKYFQYGEKPPKFEGLSAMAADFIFPQIDRSMDYARLGQKGGIAKRENEERARDIPMKAETIEITEPVAECEKAAAFEEKIVENTEGDSSKELDVSEAFRKKCEEDRFYRFWREYPKKVGKEGAFKSFSKLSPDDALLRRMLDAIKKQKNSDQWKKEKGRYIPNPENWLEKRYWEGESDSGEGSFVTDDFFAAAIKRAYDITGIDQSSFLTG